MYGPRRFKIKILLIVIILILGGIYLIVESNLKNTIIEIARSKAQLEGEKIIVNAVNQKVAGHLEYDNLVTVQKDEAGRIILLQPRTVMINRMMAQTVLAVQQDLSHLTSENFDIPLGQALGSRLFAGYGPGVGIRMMPVGRVNVDYVDRFEDAGINQTRHLICLKVSSNLKIVVPFSSEEVNVAVTIPVAESIIVGQVPGTYVHLSEQSDLSRLLYQFGLLPGAASSGKPSDTTSAVQ
jgi:sporulation protein YunB